MKYKLRYRGVPAEIRLLIWKYVLPPRVTVLRVGPYPLPAFAGGDSNRLGLFPSIQPQLLRLSKEIYDEVLPLYKEVVVHLKPDIEYEKLWPMLTSAMQSPMFGSLYYPWALRSGGHIEHFLPILLTRPPIQLLSSLTIGIEHVASLNGTNLYPIDDDDLEVPRPLDKSPYSWWIDDRIVVATFAAACLRKGIVRGDITIKLKDIESDQLAVWAPQVLRECMTSANVRQNDGSERDLGYLHSFLRIHVGQLIAQKIRITTQLSENERVRFYNGEVTFTREVQ